VNMFLNSLRRETNLALTENGATTNASSLDPVVDFFSLAGAMRNNPAGAADLFEKAFRCDPQTAVRTLFYLRDVRGGQGERDVFRAGLSRLRSLNERDYARVLHHVPVYGRWDDLISDNLPPEVVELIHRQLLTDGWALERGDCAVSLLAKWLPSENASSKATKVKAKHLREKLNLSPREYRHILSALRSRIRLLEQDMSTNNWTGIDHSKLPSQAHRRHVKAFQRHTPDLYQAYLDSVKRGEKKINVSTVYPYEIYKMAGNEYADVAWENLPDYTQGKNALVMADVSGSMFRPDESHNPITVSVSLALYFAERNTGPFKDYFMTFSGEPELVKVTGSTLSQRLKNISNANWEMNTDMLAAFRKILQAAETVGATQADMPSVLYVISDMEFDSATGPGGYRQVRVQAPFGPRLQREYVAPASQDTVFETAKRAFAASGYQLPHVVFWNVDARNMQTPATTLDGQVTLVSGLSPTVFGMAVEGKTPRQLMDAVVNGERYAGIVI